MARDGGFLKEARVQVHLSTAEIIFYLLIGAGTIAGLKYGIPGGVVLIAGLTVGVIGGLMLIPRDLNRRQLRPERSSTPAPLWRRASNWVRHIEIFRRKRSGQSKRGPSLHDWALLATSLGFCLMAALLWNYKRDVAVVTFTLFGGCGLIFGAVILRKLRERRFRPSVVRVRGGVNIYLARGRFIAIGGGCGIFGVVAFTAGGEYPLLFRALCAFVGLVGVAVLAALCTPRFRRQFIRFEPEGLVIGQPGYSCHIPWDAIRRIAPFEYASNPVIGLLLTDPVLCEVSPPARTARFHKLLAYNENWFGLHFLIAPRKYGIDAPVLLGALTRYVQDSAAREELMRDPALPR